MLEGGLGKGHPDTKSQCRVRDVVSISYVKLSMNVRRSTGIFLILSSSRELSTMPSGVRTP